MSITQIQFQRNTGSGAVVSVAYQTALTQTNLLIAVLIESPNNWSDPPDQTAVVNDGIQNWIQAGTYHQTTGADGYPTRSAIFYLVCPANLHQTTPTITATWSGTDPGTPEMGIYEVGTAGGWTLEGSTGVNSATGTTLDLGSITTGASSSFLVAISMDVGGNEIFAGTNVAWIRDWRFGAFTEGATEHFITSGAGSVSAQFTQGSATGYQGTYAAFKSADVTASPSGSALTGSHGTGVPNFQIAL